MHHTNGRVATIRSISNARCNMCHTKLIPFALPAGNNGPGKVNKASRMHAPCTECHGWSRIPHTTLEHPTLKPPPAPGHLIPLCCPRLILVDRHHPERDASWRKLPARHMDWAPNFNQTTQQWQPEWVCLRCSNTITPDQPSMQQAGPAPHCPTHGPRSLAVDLRQNERGWVCSTPHILSCEPMQIPNPAISAPDQQHQRPTQTQPGPWFRQGPPGQHQAVPHANSWFFVPLLLAGAHRLQADIEQQWQNDPRAGHEWQTLVATLRAAPPIPWRDLHNTLATLSSPRQDPTNLPEHKFSYLGF